MTNYPGSSAAAAAAAAAGRSDVDEVLASRFIYPYIHPDQIKFLQTVTTFIRHGGHGDKFSGCVNEEAHPG